MLLFIHSQHGSYMLQIHHLEIERVPDFFRAVRSQIDQGSNGKSGAMLIIKAKA